MTDDQSAPVLADQIPWFGRLDGAIFKVETLVVVSSLIVMSVLVFTDVTYQLMVALDQYRSQGDSKGVVISLLLLAFIGGMAFASTSNLGFSMGKRAGVAAGSTALLTAFAISLTHLESSTVYRFLTVVSAAILFWFYWKEGQKKRLVIAAVSMVLVFIACGYLPTGFSWAQSYSLLLLLWVGFLGASMAARQRRHLRVDLARKLLSPAKLPLFNALSYSAAGIFSAIVFYLSYIYIFDVQSTYIRPLWEFPGWLPSGLKEQVQVWPVPENASVFERTLRVFLDMGEPGEPPDWLKVLAIPVAFFLITMRFAMHAFTFGMMAVRKEEFDESVGVH